MRSLKHSLNELRQIKRHKHHPLIHKIRKQYGLSKKTLLYVKEYGPKSNVPKTILKESLKITLLASVISSIGGLTLETVKSTFLSIVPLIILMPTLNDMIGNYGTVVASRFSTLLHQGKVKGSMYKNKNIRKLYAQIAIISILTAIFLAFVSIGISRFTDGWLNYQTAVKLLAICILDVVILVNILFVVSIAAGLHFYKKNEDPDNFLIPITTSIADFGSLVILAVLVTIFF